MKLKNLTPKNLIGTKWYSFLDALDEYLKTFKENKITLLKNKFLPDYSDKVNLRDLVARKGYDLIEADGYASTSEYFKRRVKSLPTEISWLLSTKCYQYILKSFWFNGTAYGLRLDKTDGYYYPQTQILNINSDYIDVFYQTLDQESDIIYYFIGGTPVPNPPVETNQPLLTLDSDLFLTLDFDENKLGSNHFLVRYGFNLVEDYNVFISYNTAKALYETVDQVHRLKEIPHYEVNLNLYINTNKSVFRQKFVSYDMDSTKESYLESIYIQSNFSLIKYIQLGSGSYPMDGTFNFTSVSIPVATFGVSGFTIINQSVSGLEIESKIEEYGKLGAPSGESIYSFSEVMAYDYLFKPIAYVRFPKVNYFEHMLTSLKLNFICQDT